MPRDSLIQIRRGTAAAWTSANPTLAAGEGGFETDTLKFKIGDGTTAWTSLAYQGGSGAVSSVFARTGAVVAAAGDYYGVIPAAATGATAASQYVGATASGAPTTGAHVKGDFVVDQTGSFWVCTVNGTPGTWVQVVAGGGGPPSGSAGGVLDGSYPNPGLAAAVAGNGLAETSDVLSVNVDGATLEINTDALRVKDAGITAAKLASGVLIGMPQLIYRYTVTGSDKASIDTGADTPDAGSNDWTNGDVLEVFLLLRTDEAGVARTNFAMTLNNDTGANYDLEVLGAVNTTVTSGPVLAANSWANGLDVHGAGGAANYASAFRLSIPGFAGTTFYKSGEITGGTPDSTAGNNSARTAILAYRSTSAITRLKIACLTTFKFKVGSEIIIYKRRAS